MQDRVLRQGHPSSVKPVIKLVLSGVTVEVATDNFIVRIYSPPLFFFNWKIYISTFKGWRKKYFRDFRKDNWDVEVYCRQIMCMETNKFLNLWMIVEFFYTL